MRRVTVGLLAPDAVFRTCLTRRIGIVLGEMEGNGIPVYLEPLSGDLFEEKTIAPEIVVLVDDVPIALSVAVELPLAA
jgi:hypothetical protein